MEHRLIVVAADADSATGRLVARNARSRGHPVRMLPDPSDSAAIDDADAIVLVPRRGDPDVHAHRAAQALIAAGYRRARGAHLLLVSSFAVGYGAAHPFNRAVGVLPGLAAAERALRTSGLPYTIVRATWLTDDPPGAHALTFTQDARADGMLSRADLAAVLVAATEHPAARNTTFALFNEPGSPARLWARWFAALRSDREMAA